MRRKTNSKHILTNCLWRIVQVLGKQGIFTLMLFLFAVFLTPYEYGIITLITTIMIIISTFGDFGLSQAIAKQISEGKNKLAVFCNSLVVVLFLFLISLPILILISMFFSKLILLTIPLAFLIPYLSLLDGYFRGQKKFKILSTITVIFSLLSLLISIPLTKSYFIKGAIASQIIFFLIPCIVLSFYLLKHTRISEWRKIKIKKRNMSATIKEALPIGFLNLSYSMYTKADIIILGLYNFILAIGYYEIVNKIFKISIMLFSSLGLALGPELVERKRDKAFIKKTYKKLIILTLSFGLILVLILYFSVPILMNYFLADYYNPTFMIIFRLSLLVIPISLCESLLINGFVNYLGHSKKFIRINILGGLTNIILDLILLYYLGFIGVIVSSIIVHNIFNIIKLRIFYNIIKK